MTRALSFNRAAGVLKGMERRIVSGEELRKIPTFGDSICNSVQEFLEKGKDRKTRFLHFLFFNLIIFRVLLIIGRWV